jgi:hypothetical protein
LLKRFRWSNRMFRIYWLAGPRSSQSNCICLPLPTNYSSSPLTMGINPLA